MHQYTWHTILSRASVGRNRLEDKQLPLKCSRRVRLPKFWAGHPPSDQDDNIWKAVLTPLVSDTHPALRLRSVHLHAPLLHPKHLGANSQTPSCPNFSDRPGPSIEQSPILHG
jgi:hypothetical protein